MTRWMGLVLLGALWFAPLAVAYENRCGALGVNCVCSEPLQSTSYTDVFGSYAIGNVTQSKPCAAWDSPLATVNFSFGATGTFAGDMTIGTDSTILAKLPSRNTAAMARYVRPKYDLHGTGNPSTLRFGHVNMDLTTRGIKRLSLRWYRYQSSDYEWAQMYHVAPHDTTKKCTNGKIVYQNYYHRTDPTLTWQSYGDRVGGPYNLRNTGNWSHGGYAAFSGMKAWIPTAGANPIALTSTRGKWARYETIVRRPRYADSSTQGFDVELWVKNVTDNGQNNQVAKLSAGCTACMTINGVTDQNFVWGTGTHPNVDMRDLHIEDYRASDTTQTTEADGYCYGWQAYAYVMIAGWTTDTGSEFIGAADEVEGGTTPTASTGTFTSFTASSILIFLTIGLAAVSTIGMILGLSAMRRRYVARHAGDWSDPPGQSLGAMPLDGPPAPGGHGIQPVAPDARAGELVGVGAEVEGPGATRPRVD